MDVFERIDNHKWGVLGFTPAAVLWNVAGWRRYFSFCVLAASAAWILFGFDGTWSAAKPFTDNMVPFLQGKVDFWALWEESRIYYGIGNHFSAPVIYGVLFVLLSQYYERHGITKSLNFCVTTGLSLASIGLFEWTWNSLYASLQGQWWTVTWRYKQINNLVSFTLFIVIGLIAFAYMLASGYRPRTDNVFRGLTVFTLALWMLWVFYPFNVGGITVQLDTGETWSNTRMFPQTFYAVDMNPTDQTAIGEPYYVHDDAIHFLNTFTKIVTTFTLGYFFMFTKKNGTILFRYKFGMIS